MFGAPCPGRRLSSADCLLQRKLFNVTKNGESPLDGDTDDVIKINCMWIGLLQRAWETLEELSFEKRRSEEEYLWHFEEVGAVFAVWLLVWFGFATNFPKCLQLLFRQACRFRRLAPLSSTPAAFGRRPGVLESSWKCHGFFAVCLLFQLPGRTLLHDFQPSTRSFLPLCDLNCKKVRTEMVKKWQMSQMPKNILTNK